MKYVKPELVPMASAITGVQSSTLKQQSFHAGQQELAGHDQRI